MRRVLLLAALLTLGSLAVFVPSAAALSLGANFFYDDLAPYGDWFQMEDYGWVWSPRQVAADWRPYSRGHWAYADDYGWVWLSDEDFGWATDHYGRWFYDAGYGWLWTPGEEWAPAWVSWRAGDGYVGWAPLPPEYRWQPGAVVSPRFGSYFGPRQYVFVPERYFFDPAVYRYIVPLERNDSIVRATRDVTRYDTVGDRIVNRAVPVREVEQAAGRAVPRYRVEEVRSPAVRRPVVQGDTVKVFRPTKQEIAQAPAPRTPQPKPEAAPRVKARRAQPPADPKRVRLARPPTATKAPGGAMRSDADRAERQREEEKAREQQLAQKREAQERTKQQAAERERKKQEARQQQLARQRELEERRKQQVDERQKQQEQARQQRQEAQKNQQLAREREAEQRRQQVAERPKQQEERKRQQQLARQREKEERRKQKEQPKEQPENPPPSGERRLQVQPQVPGPEGVAEQERAKKRAQQERERQKREQQGRKKAKPPDKPTPPDKPGASPSP